MRSGFPFLAVGFAAALLACNALPLAGPEVQPVARVPAPEKQVSPMVFVDGRRVPPGTNLAQLRSLDIESIEIIKGEAAARLFGEEAQTGVIYISTKSGRRP